MKLIGEKGCDQEHNVQLEVSLSLVEYPRNWYWG